MFELRPPEPAGAVFDSGGTLFAAEHGPSTDDEVNRIEAGHNYGWPQVAGYRDDQAYVYANWAASSPTPCDELPNARETPDSVPIAQESDWNHERFTAPLATFFTVAADYDFNRGPATVAAAGLDYYDLPTASRLVRLAAAGQHDPRYHLPAGAERGSRSAGGRPDGGTRQCQPLTRHRDPTGREGVLHRDRQRGPDRDATGEYTLDLANPGGTPGIHARGVSASGHTPNRLARW